MSNIQTSNLDHYMMCIMWSEEDDAFIASMPELPGCITDGPTPSDALTNLREVAALWIETAQQLGRAVPSPRSASPLSRTRGGMIETLTEAGHAIDALPDDQMGKISFVRDTGAAPDPGPGRKGEASFGKATSDAKRWE